MSDRYFDNYTDLFDLMIIQTTDDIYTDIDININN